jgi:hypothetical protein
LKIEFIQTPHVFRGRLNHAILDKRTYIVNEGESQGSINLENSDIKIGDKEAGALAIVRIGTGSLIKFADSLKINRPVFALGRHHLQVVKKRF